jgi:hypothetical protein
MVWDKPEQEILSKLDCEVLGFDADKGRLTVRRMDVPESVHRIC